MNFSKAAYAGIYCYVNVWHVTMLLDVVCEFLDANVEISPSLGQNILDLETNHNH